MPGCLPSTRCAIFRGIARRCGHGSFVRDSTPAEHRFARLEGFRRVRPPAGPCPTISRSLRPVLRPGERGTRTRCFSSTSATTNVRTSTRRTFDSRALQLTPQKTRRAPGKLRRAALGDARLAPHGPARVTPNWLLAAPSDDAFDDASSASAGSAPGSTRAASRRTCPPPRRCRPRSESRNTASDVLVATASQGSMAPLVCAAPGPAPSPSRQRERATSTQNAFHRREDCRPRTLTRWQERRPPPIP